MKTLKTLLLNQLAVMYQAEQEIAKALSRMTKFSSDHGLKEALRVHSYETLSHISKVARVFDCFGENTNGLQSHAISGLLAEADALVSEHKNSPSGDAAIIAAVQKLEHYEIATYGCLRDWAEVLNNHEAAILLEEILEEEKAGDHQLTGVAHKRNLDALGEVDWRAVTEMAEEEALARHGHGTTQHGA